MGELTLSQPTQIGPDHDIDTFACGVASLDDWLRRRALANEVSGASRTYVIADGQQVVAYYCVASGALSIAEAPTSLRRNMPDPIPMTVLGRLAIHQSWQGKGLGTALLKDAVARTAQAAKIVGIRGILVHALSESARIFYERRGFTASPTNRSLLVISIRGLS